MLFIYGKILIFGLCEQDETIGLFICRVR